MPYLLYLLLVAFVVIDATAQGGIAERNRRYVPLAEQHAVNTDLHLLLPCLYLLLLGLLWHDHGWQWPVIGALVRTALFDPVTNARKHDPLFALGSSAWLDRLLSRAPWLSPLLRVAALLGSVALLLML